MKVFVAGATGVIGRALLPRLVAAGHEVVGMSNDESRNGLLRTLGAKPVVLDVFDRAGLAAALRRERPDAVIHELTSLGKGDYAANNHLRIVGTRNLVDAATGAGVERVVAQSYCLYAPGQGLAAEGDPLDRSGAFGASVEGILGLEQAVGEVAHGVILRFGRMYGPGTAFAPNGEMAEQFRAGKFVATDDVTSFVHLDDVAQSAVLALAWPKGTFNIVDDDPAAATVWGPVFAASIGARAPTVKVVAPESRQRGVSNAKAHRELAWRPIHSTWRDGFDEMTAASPQIRRSAEGVAVEGRG